MVCSPKTRERISPATVNGATRASRPLRSRSATQTTSCSLSAAIRSATSKTSLTAAAACRHSGSFLSVPFVRALTTRRVTDRTASKAAITGAFGSSTRSSGVSSSASAERVGRGQQLGGQVVVVQPAQRPLADPVDDPRAQLGRGRSGHPGGQLVRLVDHHGLVLGQSRAAVHGVDREQGVVGDHQVGRPGHLPGLLHEAQTALRAPLGAEALPHRDRDLLPAPIGVRRGVIAVGECPVVQLLLGPLAQRQHLRSRGRTPARPGATPAGTRPAPTPGSAPPGRRPRRAP